MRLDRRRGALGAFALSIGILVEFLQNPVVGPGGTTLKQAGRFIHLYNWFNFGNLHYTIDLPRRLAHRHHADRRHQCLSAGASLLHRLYGRRSRLRALLHRAGALHPLDADPGAGGELPGDLHRLGAGGSLVLPADRLLVLPLAAARRLRGALSAAGAAQGVRHDASGRLRLHDRHPDPVLPDQHPRLRAAEYRYAARRQDRQSPWR